jgi:histidine phosphotransferase ChpT
MDVDLRIAALVSARLCHGLAAPVGAVSNGIEMVEEFDASMRDEAMALARVSSDAAVDQLKYFRMAYGSAGIDGLPDIAAVRELATPVFDKQKLQLDWDNFGPADLPENLGKLILLMIELLAETIPRGGTIEICSEGPKRSVLPLRGRRHAWMRKFARRWWSVLRSIH